MRECSVTVLCKHYLMAHEVPHLYFHDHPGLHLPLPAIPLALVADIAAVVHIVSIYHPRHLAMLLAGTSSLIGLPFLVIAPLLKKFSKDLSFGKNVLLHLDLDLLLLSVDFLLKSLTDAKAISPFFLSFSAFFFLG